MTEASASAPGYRRAGKLLFQLALTGLVTWFILRFVGFRLEELREFDLTTLAVNWGLIAVSCLLLLVAYLYSAGLWGLMVREIGGHEVGIVPSLRVFFTANLGRYVPGKLWQIAGLAYLAKGEGVPAGTATGAAILGQAFSLAGATLLGAGALLGGGRGLDSGGGWAAGILLVLLVSVTFPGILRALLPLWFRVAGKSIPDGFRPDPTFGVRWMGLYAIGWVFQGLAFFVLARGLGFQLSVLEGVPTYSAAYVAGYLVLFAPAGVGVREGVLVGFLTPALGVGAAVLAVIARIWTTVVELLPALVLASGYFGSAKKGGTKGV